MIHRLHLTFRHFVNMEISGLREVNIFVGPNNVGKTSLFRAVLAAQSMKDESLSAFGIGLDVEIDNRQKWDVNPDLLNLFDHSVYWRHYKPSGQRHILSRQNGRVARIPWPLESASSGGRNQVVYEVDTAKKIMGDPHKLAAEHLRIDTKLPDTWLHSSYFLWHRRKSFYQEELGAHHKSLDPEAEHLAGRLDQLLVGSDGGSFRGRLNQFMRSVIPDLGEIGIRRTANPGDKKTYICVVFRDSLGERALAELGGGVEQVLALALVLLGEKDEGAVFLEEPESHLHESAQRRLLEQMVRHRGNRQLFIATHSPVFVNEFPQANIYRVSREIDGRAQIRACVDRPGQREVLEDLGVLPSSLTQTNCVIWVEGPTETRLIRYWLQLVDPTLKVHQHFEFAETGGANIAHLAADLAEGAGADIKDIMRICRNDFVVCDRDAGVDADPKKEPVQAIQSLVGENSWITHGYEIEWYFPLAVVESLWCKEAADHIKSFTKADKPFYACLAASGVRGTKTAEERKVNHAERAIKLALGCKVWFSGPFGENLRGNLERLASFVRRSNQMSESLPPVCPACGGTLAHGEATGSQAQGRAGASGG